MLLKYDQHAFICLCHAWLWCGRCRQTLWKGLADLCHKYGTSKVWSGRVIWKKRTNSWEGYRKLHLQATLPMVLTPFATSIQCECVKTHHFSSFSTSPYEFLPWRLEIVAHLGLHFFLATFLRWNWDQVTRWPGDQVTRWPGDQVTRWPGGLWKWRWSIFSHDVFSYFLLSAIDTFLQLPTNGPMLPSEVTCWI